MGLKRTCSELLRMASRKSSADYWREKCEKAGIKYVSGEPPQNTRMRIEAKKLGMTKKEYRAYKTKKRKEESKKRWQRLWKKLME